MQTTHDVLNQAKALVDYNLLKGNRPLLAALKFNAPNLDIAELSQLGQTLGTAECASSTTS
jgi:putative acyl-CoA dehydrogenase